MENTESEITQELERMKTQLDDLQRQKDVLLRQKADCGEMNT